jgi:hypothetical protein
VNDVWGLREAWDGSAVWRCIRGLAELGGATKEVALWEMAI